MQIIIDISEQEFKALKENLADPSWDFYISIRQAIILPKGHGRLVDANRLRSMYSINRANFNTVVGIQKWIDDAPTIIEADKEIDNECND